jgi:hypothetical protein
MILCFVELIGLFVEISYSGSLALLLQPLNTHFSGFQVRSSFEDLVLQQVKLRWQLIQKMFVEVCESDLFGLASLGGSGKHLSLEILKYLMLLVKGK